MSKIGRVQQIFEETRRWEDSAEYLRAHREFCAIANLYGFNVEDLFPQSEEYRKARIAYKNRLQPGRGKTDH